MLPDPEPVKLLHGPCAAPMLLIGARATCLYRDCDVVIVGRTTARVPWPLCRNRERPTGQASVLVNEDLARAIRCESGLALRHWFGVSGATVVRWRRALAVPRFNEGSARLTAALNREKAEGQRGVRLSPEQREQRRRT